MSYIRGGDRDQASFLPARIDDYVGADAAVRVIEAFVESLDMVGRDNAAGIVGSCRAFVLFCREQGLFAARLVALDGSKFRAVASAKRIMGERKIAEEAARIDQQIATNIKRVINLIGSQSLKIRLA